MFTSVVEGCTGLQSDLRPLAACVVGVGGLVRWCAAVGRVFMGLWEEYYIILQSQNVDGL